MTSRARGIALVAAAALVVGLAAAGLAARRGQGDVAGAGPWRRAMVGVCQAAASAATGDLTAADQAFVDVHDDLHALAGAAERDRAVPLLQDKFRVEQGLSGTPASVGRDLERLALSVRQAAASAGADPGGCP